MTTERIRALLGAQARKRAMQSTEIFEEATEHEKKEILKLLKESATRRCEALRLYEPLPFQEKFHSLRNKEVLIVKGNRAGGAQPLDGRVLTPTGWKRMGDLILGDEVIAGDGTVTYVTHIHERGWMPVYEIEFTCGAKARCTGDHLWRVRMTKTEKYPSHPNYKPDKWSVISLDGIRKFGGDEPKPRDRAIVPTAVMQLREQDIPLHPYVLGVLLGDGSISQGAVTFCTEDEAIADRVEEVLWSGKVVNRGKRWDNGNASTYGIIAEHNPTTGKPSPITSALRQLGLMGKRGEAKFIPESYLFNSVDVRLELLRGLMDTDGSADKKGQCYFYSSSPKLCEGVVQLVRSLGGRAHVSWKETTITIKQKRHGNPGKRVDTPVKRCLNMGVVWLDLPHYCPFHLDRKAKRYMERRRLSVHNGLIMKRIRPVDNAQCRCITVAHPDGTYVMDDYVVTHNSLAGFIEDARAVTGTDPYKKYPEKDGICVTVGYGEKHIGRVIHRFLFQAGAFKIIKDLETGEWRVYRPWDDDQMFRGQYGDKSREAEAKPAPPLIPPRLIERIVWEKKGEHVFSVARMTTGWEIYACNSAGEASHVQGFDVNLYHIDEDTATPGWHEEAVGRTAIPRGLIRWTALPHARNDDIMGMIERAEAEEQEGTPEAERTTVVVRASMFDNPFYPEESRKANMRIWAQHGEEVVRKRAYGEVVMDSILMYPEYQKYTHNSMPGEREGLSEVQRFMMENNGMPGEDWCIDMIVDPGHTVCAVLFIATPPPSRFGHHKVCFDELYLRMCTASKFGEEVYRKASSLAIERFIIDMHGGSLRDIGGGKLPVELYTEELARRGITCAATGSYFIPGSDNIKAREEALRGWLQIRSDGHPVLYISIARCPNTVRELSSFKKKRVRMGSQWVVSDEGDRRGKANTHAVECLEYAAAHGLEYVTPIAKPSTISYARRVIMERKLRAEQRAMRYGRPDKPSITLGPVGAPE